MENSQMPSLDVAKYIRPNRSTPIEVNTLNFLSIGKLRTNVDLSDPSTCTCRLPQSKTSRLPDGVNPQLCGQRSRWRLHCPRFLISISCKRLPSMSCTLMH